MNLPLDAAQGTAVTGTCCPRKEACPMVGRFVLQATMRVWQLRYCDADYSMCERFRLRCAGKEVPADMLPNGKRMGT